VRARRVVLAVALLASVAGCAQLPRSGPVHWVVEEGGDADELPLIDPPPPRVGATPAEIVNGFYEAMKAYPLSTDVAAQYLTTDAAKDWDPWDRTVIYDSVDVRWAGGNTVDASYGRRAALSDRGHYQPVAGGATRQQSMRYTLRLEDGEWRIVNPVDALFVNGGFFTQYFDPVSLYFGTPSGDYLVPDPIYLPTGEQLPTALVRGLLLGPTPTMPDGVRTEVPSMSQVDVSVPVDPDGVAEVRLTGPVLDMTDDQLRLLSAQVVWTLSQVPSITGVRITVSGVPLEFPGIPQVQTVRNWLDFDATTVPARSELFALESGRLVQVTPHRTPVTRETRGPWGRAVIGIRSFDVDTNLSRVGAISDDRHSLLVGPAFDPRGVTRIVDTSTGRLRSPTFTNSGELLYIEQLAGRARLLKWTPGEGVSSIPIGDLGRRRFISLTLSPDGCRFVGLARDATPQSGPAWIVLGNIRYSPDGGDVIGLTHVHELAAAGLTLQWVRAAEWLDPTTIVALGQVGQVGQVGVGAYTVRIDGSQYADAPLPVPLPPTVDAVDLEASGIPDADVYIQDRPGQLWSGGASRWRMVQQHPLVAAAVPG
jgi:hypothetical protein